MAQPLGTGSVGKEIMVLKNGERFSKELMMAEKKIYPKVKIQTGDSSFFSDESSNETVIHGMLTRVRCEAFPEIRRYRVINIKDFRLEDFMFYEFDPDRIKRLNRYLHMEVEIIITRLRRL